MEDYPQWFNEFVRRQLPSTTAQQDAGKMVRQLIESPGWRLLEQVLEARKDRAMLDLQRPGGVPDHATYAHGHGILEGVGSIRGAVDAVLHVADQAEEKARQAAESAG